MVRCEQGYLCSVCGRDVEAITDSDLYLRFVIGDVPPERLHVEPERHIRCNPELAQYVADPGFEPVPCDGPFDRRFLDPEYQAAREALVTRGWRRLHQVPALGLVIAEYPLPEVIAAWQAGGLSS